MELIVDQQSIKHLPFQEHLSRAPEITEQVCGEARQAADNLYLGNHLIGLAQACVAGSCAILAIYVVFLRKKSRFIDFGNIYFISYIFLNQTFSRKV